LSGVTSSSGDGDWDGLHAGDGGDGWRGWIGDWDDGWLGFWGDGWRHGHHDGKGTRAGSGAEGRAGAGGGSIGGGTGTNGTVTVRLVGRVTAVGTSSNAGTCGRAGADGTFRVEGGIVDVGAADRTSSESVVVSVSTTTTFFDPAAVPPSFANVCVGSLVAVSGSSRTAATVTAVAVAIHPPPGGEAAGIVTSVDGHDTPGACGSLGAAGSFVLAWRDGLDFHSDVSIGDAAAVTINVTASTVFSDPADSSPSYGDVCVGVRASAAGTSPHSGTIDAATVAVHPMMFVAGTVTSVDGSSSSGSCGSSTPAGTPQYFTLDSRDVSSPVTVDVSAATEFEDELVASPAFSDVCVGSRVGAAGKVAGPSTLNAARVRVFPNSVVAGTVASVGGRTARGSCGSASHASGSFSVIVDQASGYDSPQVVNVHVTSAISYDDQADTAPSFSDVCVGSAAVVIGMSEGPAAIDAVRVGVRPSGSGGQASGPAGGRGQTGLFSTAASTPGGEAATLPYSVSLERASAVSAPIVVLTAWVKGSAAVAAATGSKWTLTTRGGRRREDPSAS
jgi:hypothetical protein